MAWRANPNLPLAACFRRQKPRRATRGSSKTGPPARGGDSPQPVGIEHTFHLERRANHPAARSTNAGRSSVQGRLATSSVVGAQEGLTRDCLPSNVCHRGNRDERPHLIRTRGMSLGCFRRAVMEVWTEGPM
jgi:hypothetical protein